VGRRGARPLSRGRHRRELAGDGEIAGVVFHLDAARRERRCCAAIVVAVGPVYCQRALPPAGWGADGPGAVER